MTPTTCLSCGAPAYRMSALGRECVEVTERCPIRLRGAVEEEIREVCHQIDDLKLHPTLSSRCWEATCILRTARAEALRMLDGEAS